MTCKCGAATRITVNGSSYCWSCFDESRKALDVKAATQLQRQFQAGSKSFPSYIGPKSIYSRPDCKDCNDGVKHTHLCDEANFRSHWGGKMLPHFRQRDCTDKCINIPQQLKATIGPVFV